MVEKRNKAGDMGLGEMPPEIAAALKAFGETNKPAAPVAAASASVVSADASQDIFRRAFNRTGTVVTLRRGDTDPERIDNRAFLQQELVDNNYLEGKLMTQQYGHMRGTLTVGSVAEVQKDFKALGLDVAVGDPHAENGSGKEVVISHKEWAMLRTLTEFGGREAMKKALGGDDALKEAVKFRYNQIEQEYNPKKSRETAAVLPVDVISKDAAKREAELV